MASDCVSGAECTQKLGKNKKGAYFELIRYSVSNVFFNMVGFHTARTLPHLVKISVWHYVETIKTALFQSSIKQTQNPIFQPDVRSTSLLINKIYKKLIRLNSFIKFSLSDIKIDDFLKRYLEFLISFFNMNDSLLK